MASTSKKRLVSPWSGKVVYIEWVRYTIHEIIFVFNDSRNYCSSEILCYTVSKSRRGIRSVRYLECIISIISVGNHYEGRISKASNFITDYLDR